MADAELWRLSATALSAGLEASDIRADDLTDAALKRVEMFDGSLSIFIHLDPEGARKAAETAYKRQQRNERLGPLDGIPVTVKDNLFVAGLPARWGSRLFETHVAPCDDIVVERLRAAGAVILGKTTTPEFALGLITVSPLSGITRNPWDPRLTPGGSSGGAMAALATGIAPLAIGTDAGGSIRMPASYTNLAGMRPSNGRVPRRFGFPTTAHDFQSIGLAARTVEDVGLLYDVVAGPDRRDALSARIMPPGSSRTKIGVVTCIGDEPVDKAVVKSVKRAADALSGAGYQVYPVVAPFDPVELRPVWNVIIASSVARIVRQHGAGHEDTLSPSMHALLEQGREMPASELVTAFDRLTMFRSRVSEAWGEYDVLLMPTAPAPAWPVELPSPAEIGGKISGSEPMGNYCGWVNALGLPAINVPWGFHSDGRPIGVQLVAQFGDDQRVLMVGRDLQFAESSEVHWPPNCA